MSTTIPLACDLTAIDKAERSHHAALTQRLFGAVLDVRELPNGFGFCLGQDMLVVAEEFVSRERLRCPFFHFTLDIEPGSKTVWLMLTGSDGVKQFVRAEFAVMTDKLN
jgi:hypothetical protein